MYLEIDEGFVTHRKTLRFCAIMRDPNAFAYLMRLWAWACRSAPDGDLMGMESIDIEIAVQYREADGKCYEALVRAGFIDDDGASGQPVRIHNWMERTGGSIRKMADEARRKKGWRDAHKDAKCTGKGSCLICAGLSADSLRTDQGSATVRLTQTRPDQTRPDQTSFEEPPAPAIPGGTWSAWDWFSRFTRQWSGKYQRLTYGQGDGDAKAIRELGDVLQALPFDERVAAQLLATEMIAEYLSDESPGRVKSRHPWKWFVEGFNGFRAPKVISASKGPGPPWRDQRPSTRDVFAEILAPKAEP